MTTTTPMPGRKTFRQLAVTGALIGTGMFAVLGLPATAFAGDGPAAPFPPAFEGHAGTTTVAPDPAVELPDVGLTPPTTVGQPPLPPDPPDPEVNPDLGPGADSYTNPTVPPEPPLPPEPPEPPDPPEPPVEDDEVVPNPPEDCEPFDPAYPVVEFFAGEASTTVELSFQGDDQLQVCVTPLVVASYELDQPGFGGPADLVDHEVLSSEDLDDWLVSGDPASVTVDVAGCHHAVVVFWGVAIPLDVASVGDPPHVLAHRFGGSGCPDETDDGGGAGRLPETGGDVLPLLWMTAGLLASGAVIVLVSRRHHSAG